MKAYNIDLDKHANEALKRELIKLMSNFGNYVLSQERRMLLNMSTGIQPKKDVTIVHPEDIANFDNIFERLMANEKILK